MIYKSYRSQELYAARWSLYIITVDQDCDDGDGFAKAVILC